MKVRILNPQEIAWWYTDLLAYDFPDNERKPLENILKLNAEGKYDIYLYEDETVMGYATIWKKAGRTTYLLDYLGVPADRRNQGLGQILLKDIRNRVIEAETRKAREAGETIDESKYCLLLESELEVPGDTEEANSWRTRRIGFYKRNGYIPIYVMCTCGLRFTAMSYEIVPYDMEQVMKDHKEIYGPERTDVIVPIPDGVVPPKPFWLDTNE